MSRYFQSRLSLLVVSVSLFFVDNPTAIGCICITPKEVSYNFSRSEGVFVGVFLKRFYADSLISPGNMEGMHFSNFQVLQYHRERGILYANHIVSVMDGESSCGDFFQHLTSGDTVLVFARREGRFLRGDACDRYAILSKMRISYYIHGRDTFDLSSIQATSEERIFVSDSSLWWKPDIPETTRKDVEIKKGFFLGKNTWLWASFISIFFNLILLFIIFQRKKYE